MRHVILWTITNDYVIKNSTWKMKGSVKAWKKVLYEKQDYPDNYVDPEQFLNGLRRNRELQFVIIGSRKISKFCSPWQCLQGHTN